MGALANGSSEPKKQLSILSCSGAKEEEGETRTISPVQNAVEIRGNLGCLRVVTWFRHTYRRLFVSILHILLIRVVTTKFRLRMTATCLQRWN